MNKNNGKFKCPKPFLQLFVFSLISSIVFADNSTDYSDDDLETLLLIQHAPEVIPQCGVNEVYQSCEVGCIDCEKRGLCEAKNCHISHCDCRMYFVHVTPGGACEHVSTCPPRECPENEVYRHCGPYCEYCDMAQCRTSECSSRCYCKQGYRRNRETGKCIPEKECPERLNCLSNDEVAKSGPVSQHCMQTEIEALKANETIEEEQCYCPSGFKRNMHGWCIEEELCSYITCLDQTEFQDCPRKCNSTCWNYGDPNCQEDGQCYPGCFCAEGYVLNEFFVCIPLEMCPPGSNPFVPTLPPPTVSPIPEPAMEETSVAPSSAATESSSAVSASSSSGAGSGSAEAVSSSREGSGSAEAVSSSSGEGSGSEAAVSSSSEGGSGSAAAVSSSSGEGSGSSEAVSSSSGGGSGSAMAVSSSSGGGSGSAMAVSSNSGAGSSSVAAAESSPGAGGSSASAAESSTGTENTKESETKELTPKDETTEAPKKPPKKFTNGSKIYKSAARKGKTVSPTDEEDT